MTEGDIASMFIRAAETEAKLPEVQGLRESYGRYVLPWVHDYADIMSRRRSGERGERLERGDDPFHEWEMAWLTEWSRRATKEQIGHWEACLRITNEFLTDAGQRRALWAWAMAQAECLYRTGTRHRISFARWCREVERVSEMTGHRRKNRALIQIVSTLGGKLDLHDESGPAGVLPVSHQNGHVFAIIAGSQAIYSKTPMHTWRDDPSFDRTGMTLDEWRAAKRRQREAKKRKQERAAA